MMLSLSVDPSLQAYFENLRNTHYPKHKNNIPAHITLFYKYPDGPEYLDILKEIVKNSAPFDLQVADIKMTKNGNQLKIYAPKVYELRKKILKAIGRAAFYRDRKPYYPHMTFQEDVTAFKAANTNEALKAQFQPLNSTAIGIDVFEYIDSKKTPQLTSSLIFEQLEDLENKI